MKHSVQYGNTAIEFTIKHSARKTLEIAVHPDQKIFVTAPETASLEKILAKVVKKSKWIAKKLRYFSSLHNYSKNYEYISGETHQYLGRTYRLRIIQAKYNEIKLTGGYFVVHTTNKKDTLLVKAQLESWYKINGSAKITQRFEKCLALFNNRKLFNTKVSIRKMKNRWGSFSVNKKISINSASWIAPVYCIDYVIIHELCHMLYPNHSKKFYSLLNQKLPDWERRKKKLEEFTV